MFLVVLLYFICASTFTISKAALSYVSPIFFTGVRMIVAGALLLGFDYLRGGAKSFTKSLVFEKKDLFLFAQIIVFYIYFSYVLDNVALKHLTSAKACLLYNISPFLSALFSYWFFNERMTIKKWIGLTIGFIGFFPVLLTQTPAEQELFFHLSLPEILMFGAITSSVYGWIVVRQLVKQHDYSSTMINGVGMLGDGVLALMTSYIIEGWSPLPVTNYQAFIYYTAAIVLVSNIVFANLYTVLLKKYTTTFLSFAGFLAPLCAAALGWFFLGEKVSYDFFLTLFLVLIGLFIFYRQELEQGYVSGKRA